MQRIIGVINAVYKFFVGDPILLSGVAITVVVVAVLSRVLKEQPLAVGALFIIGVLTSLSLALRREIQPKH